MIISENIFVKYAYGTSCGNGKLEERNDYYPFGGLMVKDLNGDFQSYKYNGKELERQIGLDIYDYGARRYDAATCRFTTMDPLAEKYYSTSPYAYCVNNPMRFVDTDGKKIKPILYINNSNDPTNYYNSPINFRNAMFMFAKTSFGKQVIADLTPKGSYLFGVAGNGKYAEFNLVLQEEQIYDQQTRTAKFHVGNHWIAAQTQMGVDDYGRPKFTIIFDLDYSEAELVETITHEFTVHLSNIYDIFDAYLRTGNSDESKRIWNRYTQSEEHENLRETDKKKQLRGTINYNNTRDELIKKYPDLKKTFYNARK